MSGFSIRPSNFAANTDDTVAEPVTPAAAAPVATPSRQWSDRQQAIFNFITHGRGSAVVIAVAGAGKTTTIVEAANRLPESLSCAFVAFNKSIADELRSRLPRHVRAQTLNGMGFSAWLRHLGCRYDAVKIDANKSRRLCEELVPAQHYGRFAKSMPRLIGLAKSIGLIPRPVTDAPDGRRYQSPMVEDTDAAWLDIVDTFNLDFDIDLDNDGHTSLLCGYARKILERSIHLAQADPWRGERACDNRSTDQDKRPLLDFDDQLYMPVICGSRFWQHDFIFVDEAQDLNKVQRTMLRRALRPSGRLIAVGDPWQAIYAFRGATSNSMAMVEKDFHAIQLPLTISYRCPKAVVTEAHNWVSHIESHSAAPEGTVATWTSYSADQFRQTDAILCRNTRPLIELAFNLLRESVPCKVRGRDIGAGLVALVNKFKLSDQSLDNFSVRLHQWAAARIQRLLDDKKDDIAQRLTDQVETLEVFISEMPVGSTIPHLVAKIESLFADNNGDILTLSTVHKAKGMEFPRVFVLDRELMPSKFARTPEAKQQEKNLCYVAVTRAQSELVYIQSKNFKRREAHPAKASA